MQPNTKVRHSSMFLLELMITILLVSVCSAVCIRFFVQAHVESRQAQMLTEATGACTNAAELIRSADSSAQAFHLLEDAFPGARISNGTLWLPCSGGSEITITHQDETPLTRMEISYLDAQRDTVYQLEVVRYFPEVSP